MKIVIIGDQGVGKSTYLTRWLTGDFLQTSHPTPVSGKLRMTTSKGVVDIFLVETHSIQELEDAEGVILMFSWDDPNSFDRIQEYLEQIQVPAVICGNKYDLKHHKVIHQQFDQLETNYKKYDLSAKSNYNFEKPIVELLRSKFGPDLTLTIY